MAALSGAICESFLYLPTYCDPQSCNLLRFIAKTDSHPLILSTDLSLILILIINWVLVFSENIRYLVVHKPANSIQVSVHRLHLRCVLDFSHIQQTCHFVPTECAEQLRVETSSWLAGRTVFTTSLPDYAPPFKLK